MDQNDRKALEKEGSGQRIRGERESKRREDISCIASFFHAAFIFSETSLFPFRVKFFLRDVKLRNCVIYEDITACVVVATVSLPFLRLSARACVDICERAAAAAGQQVVIPKSDKMGSVPTQWTQTHSWVYWGYRRHTQTHAADMMYIL